MCVCVRAFPLCQRSPTQPDLRYINIKREKTQRERERETGERGNANMKYENEDGCHKGDV